uniref:Uncharacterized protein n=1 Tax=Rhizophora mucronata TaxID=61149 RepID=A0A2P2MBZ5_RHIMU
MTSVLLGMNLRLNFSLSLLIVFDFVFILHEFICASKACFFGLVRQEIALVLYQNRSIQFVTATRKDHKNNVQNSFVVSNY